MECMYSSRRLGTFVEFVKAWGLDKAVFRESFLFSSSCRLHVALHSRSLHLECFAKKLAKSMDLGDSLPRSATRSDDSTHTQHLELRDCGPALTTFSPLGIVFLCFCL